LESSCEANIESYDELNRSYENYTAGPQTTDGWQGQTAKGPYHSNVLNTSYKRHFAPGFNSADS
jgi:hypothetical protein